MGDGGIGRQERLGLDGRASRMGRRRQSHSVLLLGAVSGRRLREGEVSGKEVWGRKVLTFPFLRSVQECLLDVVISQQVGIIMRAEYRAERW